MALIMDTIKHNLDCTACSYSGGLGIGLGFGSRLDRCLDRGLAADGRLVKFSVTVSDRPGGIAELAR